MHCLLPLIMVIVFLIVTLILGLYYSGKTTSLQEYAIGHKKFTTATLVATVIATSYGGGTLVRTIQQIHGQGLYGIINLILGAILLMHMFNLLIIRMAPFMNNLSIAETIGQVYGKLPRIVTALSGISCAIAMLAIQINVTSQALAICINNVEPNKLSMLSTLIMIVYSSIGGIRSVAMTDIFQFSTFTIIIPFLTWFMFQKTNIPFWDIFTSLASYKKFQFNKLFQCNKKLINKVLFLLNLLIGHMYPSQVQRIYMASNVIQAKRTFFLTSIFYIVITCVLILMGIFVFIEAPYLSESDILNYITLDLPPIFKGFFAISLLAMAMSTADSNLNSCSVMICHDIIGPIKTKEVNNAYKLRLAKSTSFLVGITAMLLANHKHNILLLVQLGWMFFIPITTAPLLLAIFGFRSSSRTALIGMTTGVMTMLIFRKYLPNINGSFPAMLTNGIAMLLAHYSLPRREKDGWEKPSLEYQQLQQARKRQFYRFKKYLKGLFASLRNIPINTHRLMGLACYVIIANLTTFFTQNAINFKASLDNQYLFYWPLTQCLVALAMMIAALLSKQALIIRNRYVWLLILLFCLPIDALWHMTYVQDQRIALALFFCHFGIFSLLLPMYFVLSILGCFWLVIGFRAHSFLAIYIDNIEIFVPATLLLASLIYMQQKYIKKTQQTQLLVAQKQANIEQEIHRTKMIRYLDMVTTEQFNQADTLTKLSIEQTQFFATIAPEQLHHQHIADAMNKFINFAAFFDERDKLAQGYLHLNPKPISLYHLINHLETTLKTTLNYLPRLFIEPALNSSTLLTCDVTLITQALESIVVNLLDKHYAQHPIQQQIIAIAFFATQIKFLNANFHDPKLSHLSGSYPAIAIRLYNATTYPYPLPPIQESYDETTQDIVYSDAAKQNDGIIKAIDLSKKRIKSIIAAHYGYYLDRFTLEQEDLTHTGHTLLFPKLVILPQNSSVLQKNIITHIPTSKRSAKDAKVMGNAIMKMVAFKHFMVKGVKLNQSILSNILYLLKKAYDLQKHDNGQLLFLRAIGIAKEVATFTSDHMVIYASLLYDLPCYSWVPLSYIRANYDIVIASHIQALLSIKSFKKQQKYQQAIEQNNLAIVCVKLIERWYDLEHAKGYPDQHYVKILAQETLEVDVPVAKQFFSDVFGKNLAQQLEHAALQALKLVKI